MADKKENEHTVIPLKLKWLENYDFILFLISLKLVLKKWEWWQVPLPELMPAGGEQNSPFILPLGSPPV